VARICITYEDCLPANLLLREEGSMGGPKNEKQLSSLSTGYKAKKEEDDLVVCSPVKKRHFSGLGFRFQTTRRRRRSFRFFPF
jgi:hypothetical protein